MTERTKPILGTDQSEGVDLTESEAEALYGFRTCADGTVVLLQPARVFHLKTALVLGVDEALAGDWERVAGDFSRAVQKAKP